MLVITHLSTIYYVYLYPILQSTIHEKSCKVTTFFLYTQIFLHFFRIFPKNQVKNAFLLLNKTRISFASFYQIDARSQIMYR